MSKTEIADALALQVKKHFINSFSESEDVITQKYVMEIQLRCGLIFISNNQEQCGHISLEEAIKESK